MEKENKFKKSNLNELDKDDNPVLAMYDVRGIQSYIFKTSKLREIIGASFIVEDIIEEGIKKWEDSEKIDNVLTKWENNECFFLKNEKINAEVLFIGGGNAYVLFRNKSLCHSANRYLARYVLEQTYSLNLAVSFVDKTDIYNNDVDGQTLSNYKKRGDYQLLQDKMRDIKATMPETKPIGVFPFMAWDQVTGQPITKKQSYNDGSFEWLCTESYLKIEKLKGEVKDGKIKQIEFDTMVEKNEDSFLALVHIDGNNMGSRIKDLIKEKKTYEEAIPTMRVISRNISDGFKECYKKMEEKANEWGRKEEFNNQETLLRKIVLAGDDITFVCNAKLALSLVETFLKETVNYYLDNEKKHPFTACAGIAYFNSHYPFSDAYQVAEACCSSAKKVAKEPSNRIDNMTGCFIDYQICTHISSIHLSDYRDKHYRDLDTGKMIINRPYYINVNGYEKLNEANSSRSLEYLKEFIKFFKDSNNIARSKAKSLRNSYALGANEVNKYLDFLKSRKIKLPGCDMDYNSNIYYDALELMDFVLLDEVSINGK